MREQLETIEIHDLSGVIGGCGPLCRLLERLVARLEGAAGARGAGAGAQPGGPGAEAGAGG